MLLDLLAFMYAYGLPAMWATLAVGALLVVAGVTRIVWFRRTVRLTPPADPVPFAQGVAEVGGQR